MENFLVVEQHIVVFYKSRAQRRRDQVSAGKKSRFNGKEVAMSGAHTVQIIAGVLAFAVLGIIFYRRKVLSAN
jgi:hypothetical protein